MRVRIAPSPTGYFHIGTARTALFNYLYALKTGGKFYLRIEDTDKERSEKKYEEDILEGMKWLGFTYEPEVLRQSERGEIYGKYVRKLLEAKKAYYCFCSKELLDKEREEQMAKKMPQVYSGRCRNLSEGEIEEKFAKGERAVVRIMTPLMEITFSDAIRGEVKFDTQYIGDFAIAKNADGKTLEALYHLAVVIDDYETNITLVIRGEDHLANTPKQILIQEALDLPRPEYAHLPLILDEKRAKLSKRFAATALSDYRKEGYLPEAMRNFLTLLGWHPVDDKEIFTLEEIAAEFTLERIQKGGAIFDGKKLRFLNAHYLRSKSDVELAGLLEIEVTEQNCKKIAAVKERMDTLSQFSILTDFFDALPEYPAERLIWKKSDKETTGKNLLKISEIFNTNNNFSQAKMAIETYAEEEGRGEVLWPLRVALSGKEASPGPIEIMEVLGLAESQERVKKALKNLGF